MAEYYIYITTNLINKKIYIGQHLVGNPKKDRYLGSGTILKESIKKHGRSNFHKEILHYCYSQEEANEMETYFIDKYNSRNLDIGYNLALGGNVVGEYMRKPVRCIETGVVYPSVELAGQSANITASKITAVCRGSRLTAAGFHWEFLNEVFEKPTPKLRNSKIYCFNNGVTYNSAMEIQRELGLNNSHVIQVCRGNYVQIKGYKFKYADDDNFIPKVDSKKTSFMCLEDGKKFSCLKDASEHYGLSNYILKNILAGKNSSYNLTLQLTTE